MGEEGVRGRRERREGSRREAGGKREVRGEGGW